MRYRVEIKLIWELDKVRLYDTTFWKKSILNLITAILRMFTTYILRKKLRNFLTDL